MLGGGGGGGEGVGGEVGGVGASKKPTLGLSEDMYSLIPFRRTKCLFELVVLVYRI